MTKKRDDENLSRFIIELFNYKRLIDFWNFGNKTMDVEGLKQELNQLSSGERHMANFFASVWLNDTETFHFDMLEAAKVLDYRSMIIVSNWINSPYFL